MNKAFAHSLRSLDIPIAWPGSSEYSDATRPENTIASQQPLAVVRPTQVAHLEAIVKRVRHTGVSLSVQATGHGASRHLGDDSILVDMSAFDHVSVDGEARIAHVGAGTRWGAVQEAAEPHGLLDLAGTSPTVGVSGYTFGGGVGWLTRPHGLASGALRSVDYVDAAGKVRIASDSAASEEDRTAIRAFRGGTPVGLAFAMTFDLVRVPDLWAGYLLWPEPHAREVVTAWAATLSTLATGVTSTMAILHLPPDAPVPSALQGTTVAHLSYATPDGAESVRDLLDAVRAVAAPSVDTSGSCTAERLGQIHLDPPPGQASLGDGRWLSLDAAAHAFEILDSGDVGRPSGLDMLELRHVAAPPSLREGILTSVPGPLLYQGIGPADHDAGASTESALSRVESAVGPFDLGQAYVPFRTGHQDPGDAYTPETARLLTSLASQLDPHNVFAFERVPHNSGAAPGRPRL